MSLDEFTDLSSYLNEKDGGQKPGWVVARLPVTVITPSHKKAGTSKHPGASLPGLCPAIPISPSRFLRPAQSIEKTEIA